MADTHAPEGTINLPDLSDDRLWGAADVAHYLGTSRTWVYSQASKGALPSLKLGTLLRFEPSAVREWARAQARPGGAQ